MISQGIERRAAPRFKVECMGELAAVASMSPVTVSDISMSGCGVEVVGPTPLEWHEYRGGAVLYLPEKRGLDLSVMFPVNFTFCRARARQTRLGLQFQMLSLQQFRSLLELIDSLVAAEDARKAALP